MKNMKKLLLTVLSMSALMISACSPGTVEESSSVTPPPAASSSSSSSSESSESSSAEVVTITLDKTAAILQVGGEDEILTATVSKEGATVVWSSSNEEVAIVEDGVVTPVGEGYARITAAVGEATASCSIRVDSSGGYVVPDEDPTETRGHLVIAKQGEHGVDWSEARAVALTDNKNDPNEVMVRSVNLELNEQFYIVIDGATEEEASYRHFKDIKPGGAYENFAASDAEFDNFKVLVAGVYDFYIEKVAGEGGYSVWVEGVDITPVAAKYYVTIGEGEGKLEAEFEEVEELDENDKLSGVMHKYVASFEEVTAGAAIAFKTDTEQVFPGDENMTEEHNGNNTIGQHPYYYVHNDAENVSIYLKKYASGYSFWLTGYDAEADVPEIPDYPQPVIEDATYYLVGIIGGEAAWTSEEYPFKVNESAAEGVEEYELVTKVELKAGDKIKARAGEAYFPEGYETEIAIEKSDTYQIYFRPAGNAEWPTGFFWLEPDNPGTEPEPEPEGLSGLFLKGTPNDWKPAEEYRLSQKPGEGNEDKFEAKLDLHQGERFKIYNTDGAKWYPADGIGYKTGGETNAFSRGYLKLNENNDMVVVVPGNYFIEIDTSGDDKGIWVQLWTYSKAEADAEAEAAAAESRTPRFVENDLKLDRIALSADGETYDDNMLAFVNKSGTCQYQVEGAPCAKDFKLYAKWASGSEFKLSLGNDKTKALFDLNEEGGYITAKADGRYNFYFVLSETEVKLFVEDVTPVPTQTVNVALGAWDNAESGNIFYAYAWKNDGTTESGQVWVALDEGNASVKIPETCNRIILVRKAGGSEGGWDDKVWNQSEDMTIEEGKVLTFSGTWHKDDDSTKPSVFTWETPTEA